MVTTAEVLEGHIVFGDHPEEVKGREPSLDNTVWLNINDTLGRHERFPQDSVLSQYVQKRLDTITGGREAEVIVLHDDIANAYATPGYVVVTDGILKLFDSQEELDGILAHELTHLEHGHASKRSESRGGGAAQVGMSRAHETEADFAPLELLDKRGINPEGLIVALQKLDGYIKKNYQRISREVNEQYLPKWYPKGTVAPDPTHGSLLDRRLNLRESTWLIDIRNLSHEFSPAGVTEDDFQAYLRDGNLWSSFDTLDMLAKRHLLQRTVSQTFVDRLTQNETKRWFEILDREAELFKEADPELSEVDIRRLRASVNYAWRQRPPIEPSLDIINLFGDDEKRLANYDSDLDLDEIKTIYDVKHYAALLDSAALFKLGIEIKDEDKVLLLRRAFSSYLHSQDSIDFDAYEALLKELGHADTLELQSVPFSVLYQKNQIKGHTDQLTDYLVRTDILGEELSIITGYEVIAKFRKGLPEEDYTEEDYTQYSDKAILGAITTGHLDGLTPLERSLAISILATNAFDDVSRVVLRVTAQRYDRMMAISDPFELAVGISKYFGDYYNYARDSSGKREGVEILEKLNSFSCQEILDAVVTHSKNKGFEEIDKNALRIIGLIKGRLDLMTEDIIDLDRVSLKFELGDSISLEEPSEAKKEPNRILLEFLALDKSEFIKFIDNDLLRFRVKTIDELKQYRRTLLQLGKEATLLGVNTEHSFTEQDLADSFMLMTQARKIVLREVYKTGNLRLLHEMILQFPMYSVRYGQDDEDIFDIESEKEAIHREREKLDPKLDELSDDEYQDIFDDLNEKEIAFQQVTTRDVWEKVAEKVIEKLRTQGISSQDRVRALLEAFAVGCLAFDPQVLLQVPSRSAVLLVDSLPFDQGNKLIFDLYRNLPRHILIPAIERLIERKAKTPQELAQLETAVHSEVDSFLNTRHEQIGMAALADALAVDPYRTVEDFDRVVASRVDRFMGMQPTRLLSALLSTAHNDRELLDYVSDRWWQRYRVTSEGDVNKEFKVEYYMIWRNKPAHLEYWLKKTPPRHEYRPLSEIMTSLYLSGRLAKYAMLRKILIGEGSVLATENGRQELRDGFLKSWVEEDGAGVAVTRDLLGSLLTVGEEEELYLRLNPVLIDMILRLPQNYTKISDLAEELAQVKIKDMEQVAGFQHPTEKDVAAVARKIKNLMMGGEKAEQRFDLSQSEGKLLRLFSEETQGTQSERFTPWELALLVGEKSGAVGVRMLQLAGQYFQIPDEQKERFMNAYDNQRGQSRLQAYRVLSREAELHPEVKGLMDDVATLTSRVGGGSLMTVYSANYKDGKREAIAVKNPNAEYHVAMTVNLLKKTLADATERNPDNQDYRLMQVLLSDVEQWIYNELKDPTFEKKDRRFREQYDNDSRKKKFNSGNGRYSIKVPLSVSTGTRWVRREEYIDGKNLTGLTVADGATDIGKGTINREDYQDAISLLVRNYVHQLTEGGLVHSDIHPGNFRITADNTQLAIFDRYNLLELDRDERKVFEGFISSIRTGGFGKAIPQIVDYILTADENRGLTGNRDEIVNTVRSAAAQGEAQDSLIHLTVQLKQQGVHVPLKLSLIGKNLLVLDNMAKGAGFNNLAEAFSHTATWSEKVKFGIRGIL